MSRSQDMGGELRRQLFGNPKALGVAGGLLGVMGLIPGMPNVVFLLHRRALRRDRLASSGKGAQPPP